MTWEYEEKAWAAGYSAVCGVDEAGRGPIAGPVCAAAVILPAGIGIEGLNDSKKLSEKKREALFDVITENAVAWSVSLVDEKTIDQINILQATYRAMRQAVEALPRPADFAYVDGNRSEGLALPHECVVSGDAKIPSVAAASIVAKVTRDRLMRDFAARYPGYGFERHKGYETRAHDAALLERGPCPIHRMTFLKKFYEKHPEAPR
nr:ribonuclease HII [uncultured Agathobaculum sp.]